MVKGTTEDPIINNPTETIRTEAPGPIASGGQQPGILNLVQMLGVGRVLGPDIDKYIDGVKSLLVKDNAGNSLITIRRLSEPHGAHAFVMGNAAIVLIFEQLLARDVQNHIPLSDYCLFAAQAFQREVPNTRLLNIICVNAEDIPRVKQMADHITYNLAIATDARYTSHGIDILSKNELAIDTNPEAARSYIEQRNPHGTQPRGDLAFTLVVKNKSQRIGGGNVQQIGLEEATPIAALTAYPEIWLPIDPVTRIPSERYAVTIHITNITSDIPLPGLIPLMFAIAADVFVQQRGWVIPFMTFRKGQPNLGNLSMDPNDKNKIWFSSNPEELNLWMQKNLNQRPFLAVDVSEGQARIPGIARWGDISLYQAAAHSQITDFFGNIIDKNVPPYFTLPVVSFVGKYGDSRTRVFEDSRNIDYLNLVAQHGAQDASARQLLTLLPPIERAKIISEKTGGSFVSTSRTSTSILDPRLLTALAGSLRDKLRIAGPRNQSNVIDTPWVHAIQEAYGNSTFNTQGAIPGYHYSAPNYGI